MNNQKTLKKILDELLKPQPRIDYVVGMLEVLIDEPELPCSSVVERSPVKTTVIGSNPVGAATVDEATIMDSMAKAGLARMPQIELE